jgi:phosphatidylinositol alpha-mannosyltransferase
VRVALLSPYSWTYPGGVTRHIEALARELTEAGHEARVLAPFDPDDKLSRRLHRGAEPQRHPTPEGFVSLGRTVGVPANGAVSNMALTPHAVFALRQELREGAYDVLHIHEPVVPILGWDALCSSGELPLVGTFHTYSENAFTNGVIAVGLGGRRRMNRLHARIAVSEAAAWTARRFYGGRYRIVPNGVRIPTAAELAHASAQPDEDVRAETGLRIVFVGQAVERKGLPLLLRAFEALRDHVPATLTLVGASAQEVAHMMLDDRGVYALGKVSDERRLAELVRADVLCAPSLGGESFGMILTEAFAASTPVVASDIPGYRDVVRDRVDGQLVTRRCGVCRWSARAASAWPRRRASAQSALPGHTSPPKCSTPTSRRSHSPSRLGAAREATSRASRFATACCPPTCSRDCRPSDCPHSRPSPRRSSGASGACARCAAWASSRPRWPEGVSRGSGSSASASRASSHRCWRPSRGC